MPTTLETWERPKFAAGGGDPFLFYVVYGECRTDAPLSRSRYRCGGVPDGIDVMKYGPEQHPEVPGQFREGYLWDSLQEESPRFAAAVARCEHCTILRGTPAESATLNYLRDTVGFLTYLLDQGGVAIYDPLSFHWWQPDEWRQTIFEPAAPVPRQHTVILVSEEDDSPDKWFHTRGMRKFGRPDISVHNVSSDLEAGVTRLCNRLIELQASGQVIADGQSIRMESLPGGGVIHHAGDLDDPDFNNVHLEVQLYPSA